MQVTRATSVDPEVIKAAGEAALESLGHDVLTFLAATVAVVPLCSFLGVTPVFGFLVAGCLLGPYGLGVFANSEADVQLGDFGILFLLFAEGLNLSPDRIQKLGTFGSLGVLQLLTSMALFFFGILAAGPIVLQYVAPVLHMDPSVTEIFKSPAEAFCIAAAGALSSSAFILPVLKEKGWENRPEGIATLAVLLLQDLAVAPLLVAIPLVAGSGPDSSYEVMILVAKATLGFGAVLYAGSVALRYVFDIVAAARSTETFVAAALLVALGMGQLADWAGLSATTGAFAAGVLLANNRYRAQIKADVRPFEGILLGIFFLTAGASLDPSIIASNLSTLLAGIGVFIFIKALVLFLAAPTLGKTRAQAARVAILLSGGGEFSLVLFNLAKDEGVLPDSLSKILVASVVISMALTPLLGGLADVVGDYLEAQDFNLEEARTSLTRSEAMVLFDQIDADSSGTIEFDELRSALVYRGLNYVSIAEIFASFDTNGDGNISRDEWDAGVAKGLLASAISHSGASLVPSKGVQPAALEPQIASDAIVICGFTEFGQELYNVLDAAGLYVKGELVAFDLNPARVVDGQQRGINVVYGDGASPDLLRAAGVSNPRAVVVAFRSEANRLDATARLRDGLPVRTPIYARVISGQSVGRTALIAAGATDVVSERTEAALRFGTLVGALGIDSKLEVLRGRLLNVDTAARAANLKQAIPGIPDDRLNDMAEEFGCTRKDLVRLYKAFSSLPDYDGDQFVPLDQLEDLFLRTTDGGPIDDETVVRWEQTVAGDFGKSGVLSFTDFARVYFSQQWTKSIASSDSS